MGEAAAPANDDTRSSHETMASLANDDTKENEVVAAEDRAKSRDAAYKQSVQTYKSSRDRARALMARLNDEELALRDAATAWVDEFCAVGAPAPCL